MKLITDDAYIRYVNLDSRPDRKLLMEQTLLQHGLRAGRTRGMLPSEYVGLPSRIQAMWNRPQKGAIGCHFSQVSVMEEAERRQQHAFVMEDDLVFCSDFGKRIAIISEFCNTHPWDVIFLGGTFHINPPYWHKGDLQRDAEVTDNPRIMRTYGAFCTYAYIVNVWSIRSILRRMETLLSRSIGIDHLFIMMQPSLNAFAFVPGCVKQYDHLSDIGVDRYGQPAATNFSNFATLNGTKENSAYWWQDKMEDFDPTKFNWREANRK